MNIQRFHQDSDEPRRSPVRQTSVLLCLLCSGFYTPVALNAQTIDPPNIVVIMTDDQRADESVSMPQTLQQIAEQGISFSEAIVQSPLCSPSRATFLSGQYAHNHGVLANQEPFGYQAFNHQDTLATWLQQAGYHTIFIDRYINGYGKDDPLEIPPGWADWRAALTLRYYDYTLNNNGQLEEYGDRAADYRTDVMAAHALDALKNAPAGAPYFIWIATLAPHDDLCPSCSGTLPTPAPRHLGAFDQWVPGTLPPSFNERDVDDKPQHIQSLPRIDAEGRARLIEKERRRLESLMAVDELIARVVDLVEQRGDLDNTYFLFTSDNGYMMGEHRLATSHKKVPYEESLKVPLYIRGPGLAKGVNSPRLVSNQDVTATIIALSGASPTIELDGQELSEVSRRRPVYLFNQGQKGPPGYEGVRTDRWVYIEHESGDTELYDLHRDPFQLQSRHQDDSLEPLRHRLRRLTGALRDCRGLECYRSEALEE